MLATRVEYLDDPEAAVGGNVGVEPKAERFVKSLGAVDIGHGQHHYFEPEFHGKTVAASVREVQWHIERRDGGRQPVVLGGQHAEFNQLLFGQMGGQRRPGLG